MGEELAYTHSLSPSLVFLLPLFFPSPLLLAQCNQLSSRASYLKSGHTSFVFRFFFFSRILRNLHLTDLEVLDRTSTWNDSEKPPHTFRVTLTLHYKACKHTPLRNVQRYCTSTQAQVSVLLSLRFVTINAEDAAPSEVSKKHRPRPLSKNKALELSQVISINLWKDWKGEKIHNRQNNNWRDS